MTLVEAKSSNEGDDFESSPNARSKRWLGVAPQRPMRSRSRRYTNSLIAAHVVVFGLISFVATWQLGTADAAPDEFAYRDCANFYLQGIFSCNREHPLLAKELIAVGISLSGNSITTARTMTALFAILTAVFCYLFVTDCSDRIGGLIAAACWGLLPQRGLEGTTSLEAIRIDRFALLDPYVACFFAAGLWAGWRWATRGGLLWAGVLGAACAAAACSKAPGALVAPIVIAVPLAMRWRKQGLLSEVVALLLGGIAVAIASYGPLGVGGSFSQIAFMFNFQTTHASVGQPVLVGNHLYVHTPWWADLPFAISGLSWPIALVLGIGSLAALRFVRGATLFALAASASVLVGVGLAFHLSLPHYWIDWEPGVIVAASLGLRSLLTIRLGQLVAVGGLEVLLFGMAWTFLQVANIKPGPYGQIARAASCPWGCVVQYAGYDNILIGYVPSDEQLIQGPPRRRQGEVETAVPTATGLTWVAPEYVVIDPAILATHLSWRPRIESFLGYATRYGYRRLPTTGRIEVWERIIPSRLGG